MSKDTIEPGDRVYVFFDSARYISGVVRYYPQDTGDAWHIVSDDGVLFYVQTYEYIAKMDEAQS